MQTNTTASNNTAVGDEALNANTTGTQNVAVGHSSLQQNTTADNNTAVGNLALYANTTGTRNVAVGSIYAINEKAMKNSMIVQDRVGVGTWDPSELLEVQAQNPKMIITDTDTRSGEEWRIQSQY